MCKNGIKKRIKNRRRIICSIFCLVFLLSALLGCEFEKIKKTKVKDLEFNVCSESNTPKELLKLINEKKENPFRFSYRNREHLYIVIGYGAQDRTDLCVKVNELYLTENAIFVDTTLETNKEIIEDKSKISYPYIVLKCERYDVQVNFE